MRQFHLSKFVLQPLYRRIPAQTADVEVLVEQEVTADPLVSSTLRAVRDPTSARVADVEEEEEGESYFFSRHQNSRVQQHAMQKPLLYPRIYPRYIS